MKQYVILAVDDEPNVVRAVKRTLESADYRVITANGADEADSILAVEPVDLIVSDQKMPGRSGIEFLEATVSKYPDVVRILLTGYADLETAMRAVNSGCVYKFLLKPWQNEDLFVTVKRALEQRDLILENRDLTSQLKIKDAMLRELEKQYPGITAKPKDGIYEIGKNE